MLAIALLEAKKELYGSPDVVGHSALPEALFWCDLLRGKVWHGMLKGEVARYLKTDKCARCYATGGNVTIRLCTACKAVGYCGRECQGKHWRMGHKADCQSVDKLRENLTQPDIDISAVSFLQGAAAAYQTTGKDMGSRTKRDTTRHL
jgi:MYND finger